LIRFLRGWDGEGGARMADLAVSLGFEREIGARAWSSHDTCELDFDRPTTPALASIDPGWPADLSDSLRGTPFGTGMEILRLRFPLNTSIEPPPSGDPSGPSHRTGYLLEPVPELRWRGGYLPAVQPLTHSSEPTFVSTFEQIFAAEASGMGSRSAVSRLAARLFRGAPIEGWTGYRGHVVGDPERPIGTFFVGPPGDPSLHFGLAGLVPAARRTRPGMAAAVAVARHLRGLGATSLQLEIDRRNSASLAMAHRREATPIYQVLVLGLKNG
jgi:hypothetical protein